LVFVRSEYPQESLYELRQRALEKAESNLTESSTARDCARAAVARIDSQLRDCRDRMAAQDLDEWELVREGQTLARDLQRASTWRTSIIEEIGKLNATLNQAKFNLAQRQESLLKAEQTVTTARQQFTVVERHRQNFEMLARRTEREIDDEDAVEIWQVHQSRPPSGRVP
jgi:flagellar biosynthesis chaperone FliJ